MKDATNSVHREKMLETKFVLELYERTWVEGNFDMMIGRVDIDNGVDLTIANTFSTNLIQFKGKKQSDDSFSVIVDRKICILPNFYLIFVLYYEVDKKIVYSYRLISGNEIKDNRNLNKVYSNRKNRKIERVNKASVSISKDYIKTFDEIYEILTK
jgi:hypothetical protein